VARLLTADLQRYQLAWNFGQLRTGWGPYFGNDGS
jgi:hypothetical protein